MMLFLICFTALASVFRSVNSQLTLLHVSHQNPTTQILYINESAVFNVSEPDAVIVDQVLNSVDGLHLCKVEKSSLNITEFISNQIELIPKETQDLSKDIETILKAISQQIQLYSIVQVDGGLLLASQKFIYYIYVRSTDQQVKTELAESFALIEEEISIPQLVYDSKTGWVYVLYPHQAYTGVRFQGGEISQKKLYPIPSWIQQPILNWVRAYQGVIYCAVGLGGLNIYTINEIDGLLIYNNDPFQGASTNVNLQDVAITETNIFVVDQQTGLIIMDRETLEIVQTISQTGGFAMDCKGNNIVILFQTNNRVRVSEYLISNGGLEFTELSDYLINGVVKDVDITDEAIILLGVDSTLLIKRGIHSDFMGNDKNHFQYFYAPGLRQIEIYENNDNNANKNGFQFVAVTKHHLKFYGLNRLPLSIKCFTNEQDDINQQFYFQIIYNMTQCKEKDQLLQIKNKYQQALVACQIQENFTVQVVEVLIGEQHKSQLVLILVITASILIAILVALFIIYRKYKQDKKKYQLQIGELRKKDYSLERTPFDKEIYQRPQSSSELAQLAPSNENL